MLLGNAPLDAEVFARPVNLQNPPAALLGLLDRHEEPVLLDSAAFHREFGRFGLLSCRPIEVLTLREGVLRDRSGAVLAAGDEAIWSALTRALSAVRLRGPARDGYAPGWIGYVGYEVGRHVERLPGLAGRDTPLPDLRLAFYDALLVHDALEGRSFLVELRFARPPAGAGRAAARLRELVRQGGTMPPEPPAEPPDRASAAERAAVDDARCNFTRDEYLRSVRRCIDYIAAGDIFQVNLSQRFEIDAAGADVLEIYRALRRRNPSWYGGYLAFEAGGRACSVLSSSPELFLRVRGRRVLTRPIKGTRPRVGDSQADASAKADLLASGKDNAELAMIVDLLRNDLGRICEYGSIRVTEPRALEAHPTVFHLVGTVEGVLRAGVGPAELLRATFPGGSITGAPKIRAMEIIDELEPAARGVYTGCVGIVGVNGRCEWNIAIRTMVSDGERLWVQAGGGIVADSDPLGEYRETLDKARALFEAIAEVRSHEPMGR